MNLARFSVENNVLLTIVLVTVLALGFFSLSRLPQEQFSEVPFFWVTILVPYPGVSAADVEKSVTVRIENEFTGISKLKRISSVSSEGLALVRVEFDDGISNDEFAQLFQEARTRFGRVVLPDGTLPAVIDDFSSNDFLPVIELVLSGTGDYAELNRQARLLRDRLRSIAQVSSIGLVGSRDRQILVNADRNKLEASGINLNELLRAIQQKNATIPGGVLESRSREYILRTMGELVDTRDFEKVIVRRTGGVAAGPGIVHVGDLASVVEGFDRNGPDARFNGQTAIILRVAKVARGNSIRIIDEVKKEAAAFRPRLPDGLALELVNDSTIQIRDSIDVLVSNALQGFVALTVILLLFIGIRNAFMTALGIPVTFAITFIVLEGLGETFNSNTLFGMVLVLGMIVDHAIVLTENSFRLQQGGLSKREAAVEGTRQVIWPVISASATTVAAFLPLMLLPGTIGKFLRVIPIVVTVALVASTLEAILFIPSHYADWPGGNKLSATGDFFDRIKAGFEGFLGRLYRRRLWVVVVAALVSLGSFALVPNIRQDLFSGEDYTLFYIDINLPVGASRSATEAVIREYEKKLLPLRGNGEVVNVSSSIGYRSGGGSVTTRNNVAQIVVDLAERKEGRARAIVNIMDDAKKLCAGIPGPDTVIFRKAVSGPPTDPPVYFRLRGDDYEQLIESTRRLKDRLGGYAELFNIEDSLENGTPELRIRVNEERAAVFGLSAATVGAFIRGTLDGFKAGTVFINNEEIDIVIRYGGREALALRNLELLKIPTPDGRLIPFSAVCTVEEASGLASIKRVDGKREVSLSAEARVKDSARRINAEMADWYGRELAPRYPELVFLVGGEFAEFANLLGQILRIFLLGIFLIYAILGAQFKSFTQPLLVLVSIPFAFAGVVLYLASSGTALSTNVLYAVVALAGIAVNDNIVLLDFINTERAAGMPVGRAVIQAASTRLRPIFLTSITTIAGLAPSALGLGGWSPVWGPMASTIIFGLVFSTGTAVLVAPCLYGLIFDRRGARPKPVAV